MSIRCRLQETSTFTYATRQLLRARLQPCRLSGTYTGDEMSWQIKDQWIDLAQAKHTVVFHNPDTGAEHHLINSMAVPACPHCGAPQFSESNPVDFMKHQADTLQALNQHHQRLLAYREKHRHVRLGNGPKK